VRSTLRRAQIVSALRPPYFRAAVPRFKIKWTGKIALRPFPEHDDSRASTIEPACDSLCRMFFIRAGRLLEAPLLEIPSTLLARADEVIE
jgi:hypothetical protein